MKGVGTCTRAPAARMESIAWSLAVLPGCVHSTSSTSLRVISCLALSGWRPSQQPASRLLGATCPAFSKLVNSRKLDVA